jgi:hypothetical protein
MRAKGGTPNGLVQFSSSGLSVAVRDIFALFMPAIWGFMARQSTSPAP